MTTLIILDIQSPWFYIGLVLLIGVVATLLRINPITKSKRLTSVKDPLPKSELQQHHDKVASIIMDSDYSIKEKEKAVDAYATWIYRFNEIIEKAPVYANEIIKEKKHKRPNLIITDFKKYDFNEKVKSITECFTDITPFDRSDDQAIRDKVAVILVCLDIDLDEAGRDYRVVFQKSFVSHDLELSIHQFDLHIFPK